MKMHWSKERHCCFVNYFSVERHCISKKKKGSRNNSVVVYRTFICKFIAVTYHILPLNVYGKPLHLTSNNRDFIILC